MTIITRQGKGAPLTHAELDNNFEELRDGTNLMVPSATDKGLKVDSLGTPDFGWHDAHAFLQRDPDNVNSASYAVWRGGIRQLQFAPNSEVNGVVHIPHDYLMGSDIFIHVHWSHNSALVTGGSVTWAWEATYAKGHNQAAFAAPILGSVVSPASTTQYQHMIPETSMSAPGGSSSQFDTATIEVDGVIIMRLYLDSNDITVSGGGVPNPFIHFVDVHYRSTGVPTKNKAPNFWT